MLKSNARECPGNAKATFPSLFGEVSWKRRHLKGLGKREIKGTGRVVPQGR